MFSLGGVRHPRPPISRPPASLVVIWKAWMGIAYERLFSRIYELGFHKISERFLDPLDYFVCMLGIWGLGECPSFQIPKIHRIYLRGARIRSNIMSFLFTKYLNGSWILSTILHVCWEFGNLGQGFQSAQVPKCPEYIEYI